MLCQELTEKFKRVSQDVPQWNELVEGLSSTDQFTYAEALSELAVLLEAGSVALPGEHTPRLAWELHQCASTLGHPSSQHVVAVAHASGAEQAADQVDEGHVLLLESFAALQGNVPAQMAMGYRYLYGHGVPSSCDKALLYYEMAANAVVQYVKAVRLLPPNLRERLSDVSNIRRDQDPEIVQYFEHVADSGDAAALRTLGHFHRQGNRGLRQNATLAAEYYSQAVEAGDAEAAAYLGRFKLHGIGVERDVDAARELFLRAPKDPHAMSGLGYMHMHGVGLKQDIMKAVVHFDRAIKATKHPAALFYMGQILLGDFQLKLPAPVSAPEGFLDSVDEDNWFPEEAEKKWKGPPRPEVNVPAALDHFNRAAHFGHVQAMHKLGQMFSQGLGVLPNCQVALQHFRSVAEQGSHVSALADAHRLYRAGDYDGALRLYMRMAELGYEVAQSNAAYLMERGHCGSMTQEQCQRGSLRMYQYAAEQQMRPDASLKVGDFYYYGKGGLPVDHAKAATFYQQAAEARNPQASFNMGFLHQMGIGVPRDFHLAKRYYDLAAESDMDARAPVRLALLSLAAQQLGQRLEFAWKPLRRGFGRLGGLQGGIQKDTLLLIYLVMILLLIAVWRTRRRPVIRQPQA